jgi:hypothetical protein
MTGTGTRFCVLIRQLGFCIAVAAAFIASTRTAQAVVVISDGFGDADRNNDGAITSYDTDLNDSGTFNDATADAALIARGITEVTAATDPSDVGIIWSGIRSFDTAANLAKGKLRIINDNVAIGSETSTMIHNDGLALSVEPRGGGSSIMGRFPQSVDLGVNAGDKVVVSVDFRGWAESNLPTALPAINELRWGVFEDTDNELGMTAPYGSGFVSAPPGATVMWGRDDGNWFSSQPGAEGDKGIHVQYEFGDTTLTSVANSRIRWEYNLAGINGTTNNGRILEGNGVSDTPGSGGDVATIATNTSDGPGGEFDIATPHTLKIEIVRLADGLAEVASYIDGVEILRDEIKTTDTGYNVLQPPPFSYDYVAFRDTADFDFVLDNFKVETFAGVPGDYNNDGSVNAADYALWRKGTGVLANEVADPGTFSAADYTEWRARFGNPAGSGASLDGASVPEPATVSSLFLGLIAVLGLCRRQFP